VAWLPLIVALHATGLTAELNPRRDAGRTLAPAHAGSRGDFVPWRSLAGDDNTGNQDELPSNAALPPRPARTPPHGATRLTRTQAARGTRGLTAALITPRAPPIPASL
jgi:hypothetical protein